MNRDDSAEIRHCVFQLGSQKSYYTDTPKQHQRTYQQPQIWTSWKRRLWTRKSLLADFMIFQSFPCSFSGVYTVYMIYICICDCMCSICMICIHNYSYIYIYPLLSWQNFQSISKSFVFTPRHLALCRDDHPPPGEGEIYLEISFFNFGKR